MNSITTAYGREAINCTVKEAYGVNCMEPAVAVDEDVLILGVEQSEDCEGTCFQNIVVGEKYLMAGNYITREICDDNLFFSTKISTKKAAIVPSNDSNKKTVADALERYEAQRCNRK